MVLGLDHSLPRWLIDDTADVENARVFAMHTQTPRLIGEILPEDEAELDGVELSGLPGQVVLSRIIWFDDPIFDADDMCGSLGEAILKHEAIRG